MSVDPSEKGWRENPVLVLWTSRIRIIILFMRFSVVLCFFSPITPQNNIILIITAAASGISSPHSCE